MISEECKQNMHFEKANWLRKERIILQNSMDFKGVRRSKHIYVCEKNSCDSHLTGRPQEVAVALWQDQGQEVKTQVSQTYFSFFLNKTTIN